MDNAQESSLGPQVLNPVDAWGHGDKQTQSPHRSACSVGEPRCTQQTVLPPPPGQCVMKGGFRRYTDPFIPKD